MPINYGTSLVLNGHRTLIHDIKITAILGRQIQAYDARYLM